MKTVANTILQQLGGNRFIVMTGAKNFLYTDNSLTFRLPVRSANKSIRIVRITLEPSDTYTVAFFSERKSGIHLVSEHDDIYVENLQSVFTKATGLYTHL